MNLLFVARTLSDHPEDAAACATLAAIRALASAGHRVRVLLVDGSGDDPIVRASGAAVKSVNPGRLAEAWASSAPNPLSHENALVTSELRAMLAEEGADLVVSADARAPLHHALLLRRAGHFPECPPVAVLAGAMEFLRAPHTARFTHYWEHRIHLAERQQAALADLVVAPSGPYARELRPLLEHPERLHVVPPAVEAGWVAGAGDERVFAHFGEVAYDRSPDFLVFAANQLRESHDPARLLFLGSTPPCSFRREDVREFLTNRLHPGLRGRVEFAGRLPIEDSRARLGGAGVAVLLARHDPSVRIAAECLARGLAPLAWDDSPLAEVAGTDLGAGFISRHDFAMGRFAPVLAYWAGAAGGERLALLRNRVRAATAPNAFAEAFGRLAEGLAAARPRVEPAGPRFSPRDVTVCFFTFNDAEHLVGSLESLDAQTARPERVLVYDDGTFDRTQREVLDRIATRAGTRVIRGPNCDLIPNRMRAIVDVETPLLTMVDSDDRLAPGFFEGLLRTMDANPGCHAAIPARANFDLATEVVTDHTFGTPYHWLWNDYRMASLLMRDPALKVSYDPLMKTSATEDWHFWLRFAIHGFRAEFCPLPLFLYRLRQGSRSWPWSEGQAATACVWRQRTMAEARALGHDLTEAAILMEGVAFGALHGVWSREAEVIAERAERAKRLAVASELLDSKWFALGSLLGQMAPLRAALADPMTPAADIPRHAEQSRWMRLRRGG